MKERRRIKLKALLDGVLELTSKVDEFRDDLEDESLVDAEADELLELLYSIGEDLLLPVEVVLQAVLNKDECKSLKEQTKNEKAISSRNSAHRARR